MLQLRFVAPSDDGTYLTVHSDATGEQFALPIDDALRSAVRPAPADRLPRAMPLDGAQAGAAALSPREIQVRVRAGELPEDLAAEAGVSPDRIGRFASAVLQERSRVAAEARRARARRGGSDGELVVFGEVVDARFAAHGIDPAAVLWDAVREAEGPWAITAAWQVGQTSGSASWTFELGPRLMTPDDDTAVELLSDRPVPPRATLSTPPPAPVEEIAADNVRQFTRREDDGFFDQDAVDNGAGDADQGAQVMPLASFFAASEPESAPQPSDPFAPTDQIPHIDQAPASPASTDSDPSDPIPPAAAHGPVDDALFPAPPSAVRLDADLMSETMELAGPSDQDADERRARIPSWDDILLGVRRKRD